MVSGLALPFHVLQVTPIRNGTEQTLFFQNEHVRHLAQGCDSTQRFEEKIEERVSRIILTRNMKKIYSPRKLQSREKP
jgi:hypothetical protein